MAYSVLIWKDHSVTPDKTYSVQENPDGTITLTPSGKVVQQGTNMSAVNFNNLETGVLAANISAAEALRVCRLIQDDITGLKGIVKTVALTNRMDYPFNNSVKTVALTSEEVRRTKDYTVIAEIVSHTTGGVGDIVISDKLVNGFKVAYTGSTSEVTLNLYVQGGM